MDILNDEDVCEFVTVESGLDEGNSFSHEYVGELCLDKGLQKDEIPFNRTEKAVNIADHAKTSGLAEENGPSFVQEENQGIKKIKDTYLVSPSKGQNASEIFETSKDMRENSFTEFEKSFLQDPFYPVCYDNDFLYNEETVITSELCAFPTDTIKFVSPPPTPRVYDGLATTQIEPVLFSRHISSFTFENDSSGNEDATDVPQKSFPPTPGVVKESKYSCYGSDNASMYGDPKIVLNGPSPKLMSFSDSKSNDSSRQECSKNSPNNSNEMRRLSSSSTNKDSESTPPSRSSCDSQLSGDSSSIRSTVRSGSVTSSSSSITLLFRKKRKRDVFEDTDDEDKKSDDASKTPDSSGQFVHHTDASDDTIKCPDSVEIPKHQNLSDFEMMLKKKQEEKRKTRRRGEDFITSNDDLIDQLIDRMEEAAFLDRQLNRNAMPATKKVSMLKYVVSQLRKKNLQSIFLEHDILSTLTEWLSPLPNKCLPCLQIRENILRLLDSFPHIDAVLLRHSGIGRMVRYLRVHPDETKDNKERCNQLILKWTHPMHDSTGDYRAMTKKERRERDYELSAKYAKQKSQISPSAKKVLPSILDINFTSVKPTKIVRPGEPGWIPRAVVPQLPVRDYIKRPVSKMECEISTKTKPNRFELFSKKYKNRAGKVSFVGGKKK